MNRVGAGGLKCLRAEAWRRQHTESEGSMQASIFKGNELLFEGLTVSLVKEASPNTWDGFAYLPVNAEMDEGEYVLRLEDGRAEVVLVVSVRDGIARFRGLARPA